ncbi:MAG TPA: hypothetical protein VGI85_03760 [Chthoniobacterales bacterium]|jgi:hypothetical protein
MKAKHVLRLQFEDVTPQSVAEKSAALKQLVNRRDDLMLPLFYDFSDYTAQFYGFFAPENVP